MPSFVFVLLPRKARIDAPGVLHHIIVSGNERRKIFYDDHRAANLDKFTCPLIYIFTILGYSMKLK
jgi:hypothetical protein